ncbi:putative kinetochore protein NDC80 [Leucoagaricus sp. SymC.cos]|nr:putative kinetochore protein NDC80 [Leucoagaricus sp. SymC.cos]
MRAPNASLSLNVPGSVSRPSVMRSHNNPLLASVSKSQHGRTPLHNSTRRPSIWGSGGGGSQMPAPSGQSFKDPRPLRDKQYQGRMRQEIFLFLQSAGFDIAHSTLSNIQGKEYRAVFEFLILNLDPVYPFSAGRFEDDFAPALKALRYPYAHVLDNKWLAAPASMHSWPPLLGVLHWLVEMCKLRDEYFSSGHPTLQDTSRIPEEFDDAMDHQALAFQYYEHAYEMWLNELDEFVEANEDLEFRYNKKNEKVENDLQDRREKHKSVKAELKKLKSSEPPLVELERANATLVRDREKFLAILKRYESRKEKLKETITYEKTELVTLKNKLEDLRGTLQHLTNVVREQNLTPEEVAKMNSDHEQLSKNLDELRQRIADTHRHVMNLEVSVSNKTGTTEDALEKYTNLLVSLELYPTLAPPREDVNLVLELNPAASVPQDLLQGADIRKLVKPTLSAIAEDKRVERADLESERIKVEDELDQVSQECENLEEENMEVEKKVMSVNDQAEDLRDAAQRDALVAAQDIDSLERNIAQAKAAAIANGTGVKSRLQALEFSYREQIDRVSRLKEETVRAIIKNSHEIAMFKEEVSRHLTELRDFAEAD